MAYNSDTTLASPTYRASQHIIRIITLIMICELALISIVSATASIDHGNSNTSQKDSPKPQEPPKRQQPSRKRNQQSENRQPPRASPYVHQELIVHDDEFGEQNDPYFELKCPIDGCIVLKSKARSSMLPSIEKKHKLIRERIKVNWYKDDGPFLSRPNGNMFESFNNGTSMILYQFGESDEGHYRCYIDYTDVPPDLDQYFEFHAGAEFDVNLMRSLPDTPPTITHPPGDVFASEGDNITFTCNRTETLSQSTTYWFKSCSFKNTTCIKRFEEAYNRSEGQIDVDDLMRPFIIYPSNWDVFPVDNVTDDKSGYYGCFVTNNLGMDIRRGRLDLMDNLVQSRVELKVQASRQQVAALESSKWLWLIMGMACFSLLSIPFIGCVYLFKRSIKRDKKQNAPLINSVNGKESQYKGVDSRRRLPNIEAPDIYNTGKSVDGFISGHFHQSGGHLMAQSICSNLLDKATPSISSANSQQSDEASSSWGKSSGDHCKVFYTPASNTTATTVPLYDHPPSTGTLGHCSTFVHGACINNPTYGFLRPENDTTEWTFPRRNLDRLDKIGEGQFGEVWRYVARRRDGKEDIVAVKQLKNRAGLGDRERLELIAEIEIMKSLNDHPNVIKLLHYCIDECGPILLIMEYADNGKLQTYLRKCREPRKTQAYAGEVRSSPNITSKELLKFTYHIAKGMEYVASQGIVHRDLASRNILVSEDHVCKVADFGFARRVNEECAYERTTTNPVPVKWMAPEALVGNKFTSKSDVFSLGILMWEIVTLGATPYEQLTSEGVYKKVTTGGRLDRPPHCKDEFYNLMAQCWLHDPVQRPTFKEVASQLEKLLLSENDYIELDQYPEHAYYNILNTAEKEVVKLET